MILRSLEEKDAKGMLEWMTDKEITQYMQAEFANRTIEDCLEFINKSHNDENNKHFAVCNDADEYLGTISLKNISKRDKSAEYAVIFRKCSLGTGVSLAATKELLRRAFEEIGLNRVYLDVLCENQRAIKFYDKVGFVEEGIWKQHFFLKGQYHDIMWLRMLKEEWMQR